MFSWILPEVHTGLTKVSENRGRKNNGHSFAFDPLTTEGFWHQETLRRMAATTHHFAHDPSQCSVRVERERNQPLAGSLCIYLFFEKKSLKVNTSTCFTI